MSVELAWLLTKYGDEPPMKGIEFSYSGRQELKSVLNDRPYPIISIDVERSAARRKVRERERDLLPSIKTFRGLDVHDFLESFIDDERMVRPWLRLHSDDASVPQLPKEYEVFRGTWEAIALEIRKRSEAELQAAEQDNSAEDPDELSAEVMSAGEELVERAASSD